MQIDARYSNFTKNKMILITGASGFLGRKVYNLLPEAIGTYFSRPSEGLVKLDLADFDAVNGLLDANDIKVIIHCAAERRPDVAAQDPSKALKLNVKCTKHLAMEAKKRGIYLIYISTDYVFDGLDPPYKEDDAPNPINFYGKSKWLGEQEVLNHCDTAMILRVPVLYGPTVSGKNAESAGNFTR
jgi:S-adenosylmethionine synthetase